MSQAAYLETDVLVIGGGLAGLGWLWTHTMQGSKFSIEGIISLRFK